MNAEEVARELKCSSKTVLRHIKKGTITATHKNTQELEIAEDQVEILRRVLASKSGQSTDMVGEIERLTARVAELEERVKVLESGQVQSQPPVQTVLTPVVPTAKTSPLKPQKQPSTRKDLPEGCILASKFAEQIGIPRRSFSDYMLIGFGKGLIGYSTDTIPQKEMIEYSERPKPGREHTGEVERYLTPEQQTRAVELLRKYGKLG
jgi:polyhydroxyalkanoate synthesis regulator phasin